MSIVEKDSTGAVTDERLFIWAGLSILQERDGNNTITKNHFANGFENLSSSTQYYYTKDHLGSIREITDSTGTLVASYDYTPYGTRTLTSGTDISDFGYTGHFTHAKSGLLLAPYRAYDPQLGRWLSRDPIAENGGINLYHYTFNNPINAIDPDGLDVILLKSYFRGYGHTAILVGDDINGWVYASHEGIPGNTTDIRDFPTLKKFRETSLSQTKYHKQHRISCPKEKDDKIKGAIANWRKNYNKPMFFNVRILNCADFTRGMLSMGGFTGAKRRDLRKSYIELNGDKATSPNMHYEDVVSRYPAVEQYPPRPSSK